MKKDLNTVLLEGIVIDMDIDMGEKEIVIRSERYQIIKDKKHKSSLIATVRCPLKAKAFIGDSVMVSGELRQEKEGGPLYLWSEYVNVINKSKKSLVG